jgi:starch synthase
LTGQKGLDLLIPEIEHFIDSGYMQFIMLGSGEKKYENYFNYIKNRYSRDTIIEFGYNNTLSHKIYAAADYFLIPSRYEPCGLTQMYAMSYGAIPIVRLTGGLADTVEEYNAEDGTGEGFRFWRYNSQELTYAMSRALETYQNQPHWDTIRQNAMNKRFTAEVSAQKYLEVFAWALGK